MARRVRPSRGPTDVLVAAYALTNDATVLAAERVFVQIAEVTDLRHEQLAPSA